MELLEGENLNQKLVREGTLTLRARAATSTITLDAQQTERVSSQVDAEFETAVIMAFGKRSAMKRVREPHPHPSSRIRSPSRNTFAVWLWASTWVTMRGPIEKVADESFAP